MGVITWGRRTFPEIFEGICHRKSTSSPLLVSSPSDQTITLAPRGRRMSARSARVRTAAMRDDGAIGA
eukprot:7002750-Prymnesium_polylepis.1